MLNMNYFDIVALYTGISLMMLVFLSVQVGGAYSVQGFDWGWWGQITIGTYARPRQFRGIHTLLPHRPDCHGVFKCRDLVDAPRGNYVFGGAGFPCLLYVRGAAFLPSHWHVGLVSGSSGASRVFDCLGPDLGLGTQYDITFQTSRYRPA